MEALRARIERVIVGQADAVDAVLTALLCRGHVLMIGVPGLAKTMLAQTVAHGVGLDFRRVQFTPDMMPADILGSELLQHDVESGRRAMEFMRGPIFTQLLLADEINRTPPRTQAALLEAMAERQVTAGGRTMPLADPFVVLATQNPIEQEGTYPLPEAQLDRFMLCVKLDYPSEAEERRIVGETQRIRGAAEEVQHELSGEDVVWFADLVARVPVSPGVVGYAVALARATRPGEAASDGVRKYVEWGAGPRAGQALVHAGQAYAAMAGRPTVSGEDLRRAALPVLRHRVLLNYAAAGDGVDTDHVVRRVVETVKEPIT